MTMQKIEIKAEKRTVVGKSLENLRQKGFLPAVIYGHNFDSLPIQVDLKEFEKAYSLAGESSLIYVKIDDKIVPAIINDVSRNAVSDKLIHADFYKVNLNEKITATVQLVFVGESLAVKDLAGILVKNINEIEVEALPQDLPHEITVDISVLRSFSDHIFVKDLVLPSMVVAKAKAEDIIALVQEPISQEELDKQLAITEGGVAEVEVIKKEAVAEEGAEAAVTGEEAKKPAEPLKK